MYRKQSIERHYHAVHKIKFCTNKPSQKLSLRHIKSEFLDAKDFIGSVVRVTAKLNLAFRSWDEPEFRRFIRPYEKLYNVRASARTVRIYVKQHADLVIANMKSVLKNRLFALKFDIASRKGKSYLGMYPPV